MPGHSRSKNGVASLAYVPGIHAFGRCGQDVDGRNKPGHDEHHGALNSWFGNAEASGTLITMKP